MISQLKSLVSLASKSLSSKEILRPPPSLEFLGFADERHTVFRADLHPSSSDPAQERLQKILEGGYTLKIKRNVRKMTIFRFLLAKLVYEPDKGLSLDEFIVLSELYPSLLDHPDPSFQEKWKNSLERINPFLQKVWTAVNFPVRLKFSSKTEELYSKFLEPIIPSKFAYIGLKGQRDLQRSYTLSLRCDQLPPKVKEASRIGVGYRDKGSRKSESFDGSPSWQEVASHYSELERRMEEERELWYLKEEPDPPSVREIKKT
jgi:hypothetical protein